MGMDENDSKMWKLNLCLNCGEYLGLMCSRRGIRALSCAIISHPAIILIHSHVAGFLSSIVITSDIADGLALTPWLDAMVSHPAAIVISIVAKSSILGTRLRTHIVTLRPISSVVACHHWNAVVFIFSSPAMKLICSAFDGSSRRGIKALSCAIISHPTSVFINSTINHCSPFSYAHGVEHI